MAKRLLIILSACCLSLPLSAQYRPGPGYYGTRGQVIGGDTVMVVDIIPVYVFSKPADMRKHARLVRNVKAVYPIAKYANNKLLEVEAHMETLPTEKERAEYIKRIEKELKAEFTPILKKMTFSQGKVLVKLIDRETHRTSYQLVKDLRGNFSAFFWQSIARLFGANLKDSYNKDIGEDKIIEQIIIMYEAGLI